jgi:ABC-type nitrate/sulfonate/bicarbonate transport system substrate-binding protein
MFPTLKLGYIDGYCVGEPWTSLAVQAGIGMRVATSAELAPLHPERVLMVRQSFAAGRAEEHERMIAALLEACAFCDLPENRQMLGEMLAHPQYVNAPSDCIRAGLLEAVRSRDLKTDGLQGLTIFHRHHANEPSDDKARWVMERLYELLQQDLFKAKNLGRTPVLKNVFRKDIFERARALGQEELKRELTEAQACEAGLAATS